MGRRERNTETLERKIMAISERANGTPYTEVLDRYSLTPDQFAIAVFRAHVDLANEYVRVSAIIETPERVSDLFNMGEEFVRQQYDRLIGRISGQKQSKFYQGTFLHPKNISTLVYYALASNNPTLASKNRDEVIEGIKQLPTNLVVYLRKIGLGGLLGKSNDSPLSVLEIFDGAYREKTGDPFSLFDLTQKSHLHKWGDNFVAPNYYWQDDSNINEAVYHAITEKFQLFSAADRKKVTEALSSIPGQSRTFFRDIGLRSVLSQAFPEGKKDYAVSVLEVFDKVYQQKTGQPSLFDLSQPYHLHKWGEWTPPNVYVNDPFFVAEAVYHTLTEEIPSLKEVNRDNLITAIKRDLPLALEPYFQSLYLGWVGGKSKHLRVLRAFDMRYQQLTGQASLFDKGQANYLSVDGKNRLSRV